jgi:hypothetical protein
VHTQSSRQIGWQAHRVDKYNFYNDYNSGPPGSFSSIAGRSRSQVTLWL